MLQQIEKQQFNIHKKRTRPVTHLKNKHRTWPNSSQNGNDEWTINKKMFTAAHCHYIWKNEWNKYSHSVPIFGNIWK
jgi:hypothetical protein